jgi:predicted GNAT family acetyltransferase
MQIDLDQVRVVDNRARRRFEAAVGADLAIAAYERAEGQIIFVHTEGPPALRGHGVAEKLVQAALDTARAEGLAVVPQCPFVAAFIRRHPAYQDLVRA